MYSAKFFELKRPGKAHEITVICCVDVLEVLLRLDREPVHAGLRQRLCGRVAGLPAEAVDRRRHHLLKRRAGERERLGHPPVLHGAEAVNCRARGRGRGDGQSSPNCKRRRYEQV